MARLTYQELTNLANSHSPDERKRGYQLFKKWIAAAKDERIPAQDQLTHMERTILEQMFAQKGLGPRESPARTAPLPTRPVRR
jgi:hypothetical protein